MAITASRQLVDYLEDRAGDALRVVFHYDTRDDDWEILHLRDDIATQYSRVELADHFETFRRDAHLAEVQSRELETGAHHCSIRIYDETLLFNFTLGSRYNTIISLDPNVGRDLLSFVTEAIEQLNDGAELGNWDPPRWV